MITHTLADLEADLRRNATTFKPLAAAQVRDVAKDGNRAGKAFAKVSAGRHGKHYHKAFTVEARTPLSYEWGPDSAMPQGGMSFEYGSRNQKPHLDLARAADQHGAPDLLRRMHRVLDGMFW